MMILLPTAWQSAPITVEQHDFVRSAHLKFHFCAELVGKVIM